MSKTFEENIKNSIDDQLDTLMGIKRYLYEFPETGGEEEKSSALLIAYLRKQGFEVTEDFCDIPWAFRAAYDSGRPGVAIGFTAEYDALPEIGHACGHNIIASAPTGAAVALRTAVDELGGKVVLYGTPGEENLDCKIDMANAGAFSEVDVLINIHPYGHNQRSGRSTAFDSWKVDFYGKAAHAGLHPEDGINALDTAVYFYQMVNYEKLEIDGLNLHGVIPEGGVKYSIIPDHTVVKFAARAYSPGPIKAAEAIIRSAAEAACEMNGSTYTIEGDEAPNLPLNTNRTLAQVFEDIYEELSGEAFEDGDFGASLDLGDVSWKVPTIVPLVGIGCPGTDLHTPEFREATMTEAGDNAMKWSAEAMALTGLRVMEDPELLRSIRKEFVHSLT